MTRENISTAWRATKEKATNAVTTVRDPEFQEGVKNGVSSFFSKVKKGSLRLIGYLTEQEEETEKKEQPKKEGEEEKGELDWDDEQEEIKRY